MPELRLQAEGSAGVKEPEGWGCSRSGQNEKTELGGRTEVASGQEGRASAQGNGCSCGDLRPSEASLPVRSPPR